MLAIVQFSSFTEDGRRGTPATRSLKTEQRFDKDQASLALCDRVPVDVSGTPTDPEGLAGGLLGPALDYRSREAV